MARILLIETATEVCSAAIAVDGEVVALVEEPHSLSHAALLTLQIDACVRTSGIPLTTLDAVAVSRGPGSYTALRVGAAVAKGICYTLDKPLIAVDTLHALAWASRETFNLQPSTFNLQPSTFNLFLPMLDARRQEVWLAAYDAELRTLLPAQPLVLENDLFENLIRPLEPDREKVVLVVSGNGSEKLRNVNIRENVVFSPQKKCSAEHLKMIAERNFQQAVFQDVAYFEPFYMKPPNITTPSRAPF